MTRRLHKNPPRTPATYADLLAALQVSGDAAEEIKENELAEHLRSLAALIAQDGVFEVRLYTYCAACGLYYMSSAPVVCAACGHRWHVCSVCRTAARRQIRGGTVEVCPACDAAVRWQQQLLGGSR